MWKWWIAGALGALVAVPALMVLVGLFLPRAHEAACRARFDRSPETLWAALTDFPRWPEWNPMFRTMERAADRDGKPVWVGRGKWGAMPLVIETLDPPRRIVTRIPEDAGQGFSGSWTYEIEPSERGATLSITERGEVGNPLFRVIGTVFFDQRATARGFLRALGRSLGETVEPQDVP
jgi:uncharacterized protein YndB with AHSA1/START domain